MNGDTSFYFLTQKEFPQTINFISTSGNNNNNNINELISYPPNQSQTFREENQTSTPFSQFQEVEDSPTVKKVKKKRNKCVTIACENCRSKHTKCDAAFPCSVCVLKGLKCTYDFSSRKKRGHPIKASKQMSNTPITQMTVPTTISELELNRSHMYSNYLEAYNQKMYPLSAIPIPEHLFGLQTAEQQGSGTKIFLYSIMGIGALLMGDKVNSLEFINSAKMHIDLFEKPSPELSAGLLLLSSLLMLDCRLEGSRNVMALGMSMLSLLKEKKFSSDFFEIVERMGEHSRIEHNYTWDFEGRSINMKNLADSIDETKNYEARIHKFSSLANLAQYQALAKKPYRECLDSLERAKNLVLHLPFYKKHYEPLVLSIQATIDYCNGYHHLVHRSLPLFEEYSEQEFNFSSWILELTLIQIKIAYSLPIDKQMEKFRKISLRIPLILELLNQIINPSIERTPLIPCLPKLHEVPMQPLVPSSPLIEIINGNGAPFLEEFDPELLSQTEFNLSELEKPFDFGFNNSPSSMNCSNQCLSNSPIQTSSSPIVPSQITVFFKTIIQSQTFRVTPNLTCGQLIEQTPINNPHNYILVDKTGSTLPKNALIVDIFKESNPVVELKEKPFWS